MIALDASVLISHLEGRDPHHLRASDLLRASAGRRLMIHPLNLAEVLVGGVRIGRGEEMLADIEKMGVLVAEPREGEPLRLATLRATTGLRLPDCCALDLALRPGAALATFDEALAAAARQRGVTVLPDGRPPEDGP